MRIASFHVVPALVMSGLAFGLMASNAYAQTTYTGGPGGTLVDGTATNFGEFDSDLVISGTGATVTNFNSVTLTNFTHTFIGDLVVVLTKVESGESITLVSPPDATSANFNGTYTFVVNPGLSTIDEVAAALTTSQNVAPGSYAISDYGGGTAPGPRNTFAGFTGVAIDGTWELSILDFAPTDTGALGSWQFSSFVSTPVVVPESGSLALALPALGMIGAVIVRRRKK